MLLHMAVIQHILEIVQRDVLGHARSCKHGTIAVKLNARQDCRGLAAACARQLCYDLKRNQPSFQGPLYLHKCKQGYMRQQGSPGMASMAAITVLHPDCMHKTAICSSYLT